jgi:hypothetical protein
MKDRVYAEKINADAEKMLDEFNAKADKIYDEVREWLSY